MDADLTPEPQPEAAPPDAAPGVRPPATGHPGIDAALEGLELGPDVHAHHEALLAAVEAVQRALNPADQGPRPRP